MDNNTTEQVQSRKKQKRKKSKRVPIIVGLVVILILSVGGYLGWQAFTSTPAPVTETTNNNEKELTAQQKAYLAELTAMKPFAGTEEESQVVGQNFVAQFFTLSNVPTLDMMGGLDFIVPEHVEEFKVNASSTYLFRLEELKEMYGLENLPTVDTVTIENVNASDFYLDAKDTTYSAYTMDAVITYTLPAGTSANNIAAEWPTRVSLKIFYDENTKAWYVGTVDIGAVETTE